MKAFDRQPPPRFWHERVCRWVDLLARGEDPKGDKLHEWSEQKRTLAEWFHDGVRPAGDGPRCAYCDGLFVQSPRSIDHWVPSAKCPPLHLWWGNLFPACFGCQMAKGTKWPVTWLRPDLDDVEALIVPDLATGRLEPAAELVDEDLKKRIQDTIDGIGLNRGPLARERWRILQSLLRGPIESVLEKVNEEPYRFLRSYLNGL